MPHPTAGDFGYLGDVSGQSSVSPYGSARDLPSVQEMERQIAAFKVLGLFLPRDQRRQIRELEHEHRRLTVLVDSFYELLGPRNWVFTGDLNVAAMERVVAAGEPERAEARLVEYYKEDDRIAFSLAQLHRFDAIRPRIELLEKALADYEASRYYSTVLVLLTVMDGFVNDLDKSARRGLHARPVEDMVAWDSVAGHHLGLGHAQESFLKGFRRTDLGEVTELYRNGIMHGTLVNFDNELVATKAWNRLFAIADWADGRQRLSEPAKPSQSLRESLERWKNLQARKSRIEQWEPHEYDPKPLVGVEPELVRDCTDFLERWQKRQWGPLGAYFIEIGTVRASTGERALQAKKLYGEHELSSWDICRVRHEAAAVAHTEILVVVNGTSYKTSLRWVRIDDKGSIATEWEPGRWVLSLYGPANFLKPEFIEGGAPPP